MCYRDLVGIRGRCATGLEGKSHDRSLLPFFEGCFAPTAAHPAHLALVVIDRKPTLDSTP
jgi:hypothetical protein